MLPVPFVEPSVSHGAPAGTAGTTGGAWHSRHPCPSPSWHPPTRAWELQGSVCGCSASMDSLSRTAQPFPPGQRRGAAPSRQLSINGVFYLTGEIKSQHRGVQKC